jgi:hypothetical protein
MRPRVWYENLKKKKEQLGRPRRRGEENINIYLRKFKLRGVD